MSRGSPYFSAPALMLSAGLHVLVLVLLLWSGNGDKSGAELPQAEVPAPPPAEEAAEKAETPASSSSGEKRAAAPEPLPPVDGPGETGDISELKPLPLAEPVKNVARKDKADEAETEVPQARPSPSDGEIFVYTVQRGDNLTRLAAKYGMTVKELAELNGKDVKRFANLWVGQKIKIRRK